MKKRIDILIFERGLAKSREKAKALIISGNILVNGHAVNNPSEAYNEDCSVTIKQNDCPYVSRGALKLKKALDEFKISLDNKICADIGASTGGFSDCMLKYGASKIYAIDVGYGQLDWNLRNDPRIINMERINARYLNSLPEKPQFISVDVSFISLSLIFPAIIRISHADSEVVTLIKPQFEAGRDKVGKKGVVKDKRIHAEVIKKVFDYANNCGLAVKDLTFSPLKGPNGNIEFLARFIKGNDNLIDTNKIINITEDASLNFA